jgi:hypothetical protein
MPIREVRPARSDDDHFVAPAPRAAPVVPSTWTTDMKQFRIAAALACVAPLACHSTAAMAHAVCGPRIFPVTLTMDDPGVADEASLPTFTYQRSGADGGPGPVNTYGFGAEYDKRITTNLGIALNWGWNVVETAHAATQTGADNLVFTAKYSKCLSPDHEFIAAVGVQQSIGGTGTLRTGADEYGTTAPTFYFGKGLGDLPIGPLRALAVTGELSYGIANKSLKATQVTDPSTGLMSTQYNNGNANQWNGAMSLQYSIPYLQSQVKDFGLPDFVGRLTPVVEVSWSSAASAPNNLSTTWTVAPGVLYNADTYQIGLEALIPANKNAGSNVGVIAQFHIFLDDIFPNTLGKPLFN